MDRESPIHRKKKPSSTSKASSRSNHKHEYGPCILKYLQYSWGERCRICGRIRYKPGNRSELLRPECRDKPYAGIKDYLSIREMKETYPGIRVFDWEYTKSGVVHKEIFE